jgi:peptide deformylase
MEEGCLSFPELGVKVCRAGQVKIKALDEKGKDIIIDAQDLLATVLQHEIDHLNGKLLIDYVSWPKRWFVVRKLKKAKCAL